MCTDVIDVIVAVVLSCVALWLCVIMMQSLYRVVLCLLMMPIVIASMIVTVMLRLPMLCHD